MEEKNQFFRLIGEVKRKLWLNEAIRLFYYFLLISAGAILLWALCSRFFIILFMEKKIAFTVGILAIGFICYFFMKKPTPWDAAKKFDEQGLNDRAISTFHFLDEESDIVLLQRKDTIQKMKEVLPRIKQQKMKWFYWKSLAATLGCVLIATAGLLYPNTVMSTAQNLEKEQKVVKEQKEKIEKFAEKHREQANREIKENLDELLKEVKQEKKAEEIQEDLVRAEKKLAELKKEAGHSKEKLNELSKQLKNANLQNLAQAINQMNKAEMENQLTALLNQWNELDDRQLKELQKQLQKAAEQLGVKKEQFTEQQLTEEQLKKLLASMEEQMKKLMEQAASGTELAAIQTDLQQLAQQLNQQMVAAGLGSAGSLTLSSGSPSSAAGTIGQTGENTQGGQSNIGSSDGSGSNSGNGAGSGSGSGSGAGNGSGSGSGSSSGSGMGTGAGLGTGNGAGLGAGNHNLTVPQQLDGKENTVVDKGELGQGASEQQISPNAPILPGEVRHYDEVYQQYESTYRQAIERNDYPDHLQTIIKQYFSELENEQTAQ